MSKTINSGIPNNLRALKLLTALIRLSVMGCVKTYAHFNSKYYFTYRMHIIQVFNGSYVSTRLNVVYLTSLPIIIHYIPRIFA